MITSIWFRLAAALALLPLFSATAHAVDIGRTLRSGQETLQEDNYAELGISVIAADGLRFKGDQRSASNDVRVAPAFNARYQWRGLFAEAHVETRAGWTLGYNAYNSDTLSLDFIIGSRYAGISPDISDELGAIEPREGDVAGGFRLSGYAADYLWQLQGWSDVSDTHGGHGASALVGRNWQVRNWNFHALAGIGYASAGVLDYYYGVTPGEAAVSNGNLTAYDAGSGVSYSAEAGVTYPLTRSWIVRTTARYGRVTGEVAQSTLFDSAKRDNTALIVNVSYVF